MNMDIDPWNASYHTNPMQIDETIPINYNQQNYMTNEARETSVESLNIDSMTAKNGQQYQKHAETLAVREEGYILMSKYVEQIKSISAG